MNESETVGKRHCRATERVLSVGPSFDIGAVVTGRVFADEIRRRKGGSGEPDPRPSIGNAALAARLSTLDEDGLRDYMRKHNQSTS